MSPAVATRPHIYRRLAARNRFVATLRILVPVSGVLILAILLGQIYLSSLTNRFGLGNIKITSDSVTIESPEYSGVLQNGSRYHVIAKGARASIEHSELIDLTDAAMSMVRPNGSTMEVNAPLARLDTTNQIVTIDGAARVEDSSGTVGKFYKSVFDVSAQVLDSGGPVAVEYADGTTLVSKTMHYESQAQVWTFSNVTVTLPQLPGAKAQ